MTKTPSENEPETYWLLRVLREKLQDHENVESLSKICGIGQSTLSRFKTGAQLDLKLSSLGKLTKALNLNLAFVEPLPDLTYVNLALEQIANSATQKIMTIGAKSRSLSYHHAVEKAVQERSVTYERVIDSYTTHDLHEHINRLIDEESVTIRRTEVNDLSQLTIADEECVLLLPAPHSENTSGLRFRGYDHTSLFSSYFQRIFDESQAKVNLVTNRLHLESLCERCTQHPKYDVAPPPSLIDFLEFALALTPPPSIIDFVMKSAKSDKLLKRTLNNYLLEANKLYDIYDDISGREFLDKDFKRKSPQEIISALSEIKDALIEIKGKDELKQDELIQVLFKDRRPELQESKEMMMEREISKKRVSKKKPVQKKGNKKRDTQKKGSRE